jgi:SAM-dependent methyltransferase
MHPKIKFRGVDNKDHMIQEAQLRDEENAIWLQSDALDEAFQSKLNAFDGILMRYFVLHLRDTEAALLRMLRKVRPGTRLWIFDLDIDHSKCEPKEDAFNALQEFVRSFCEENAVKIKTGSTLPPILDAAGFRVDDVSVEPFDNQKIDPALFAEYLFREATLYYHFLKGAKNPEKLREIEHFLFNVMRRDTHFVQYGMTMIGAVKRA